MRRKSRVIGWWAALAVTAISAALVRGEVAIIAGLLVFIWTLSFALDHDHGDGSRLPWGWRCPDVSAYGTRCVLDVGHGGQHDDDPRPTPIGSEEGRL